MNEPPKTKLRLLKIGQVVERTALSPSTIERRTRDGTFPQPVPLTRKVRGWVEHEIDAWILAKIEGRDDPNSIIKSRPARQPQKDQGIKP